MSETETANKETLLAELQQEQAQWEALLAQVGEERMTQPGLAGEWTFKELLSHLTGWRRRSVERYQAALRGESMPATPWPAEMDGDEDAINAWMVNLDHDRSVAEVVADNRAVFQQLYDTLAAFSDAELHDPTRFPWLADEGGVPPLHGAVYFDHYHDEHEPDVRAWLAKMS